MFFFLFQQKSMDNRPNGWPSYQLRWVLPTWSQHEMVHFCTLEFQMFCVVNWCTGTHVWVITVARISQRTYASENGLDPVTEIDRTVLPTCGWRQLQVSERVIFGILDDGRRPEGQLARRNVPPSGSVADDFSEAVPRRCILCSHRRLDTKAVSTSHL